MLDRAYGIATTRMTSLSRNRLPSVSLHLGAHKTGTTFMQDVLVAKRTELAQLRVAMIPLKQVRTTITRAAGSGDCDHAMHQLSEATVSVDLCDRIVVSDENISGRIREVLRPNQPLYPSLAARLDRLRQHIFSNRRLTVYFGVRCHEEFLPAVYSEMIRHNDFCTFEEYLRGVDILSLSWASVVRSIASVVGEKNMVIWDFGTFKKNPLRIAAAIAGVPEQVLAGASANRRPSASGKAIQALTALRAVLTDAEIKRLVRSVEGAFPQGSDHPVNRPFDERTAQQLRERHRNDWNEIRQDFSSAVFI